MNAAVAMADVLGLTEGRRDGMSPLALIGALDAGLPLDALARLARSVSPGDAAFPYRLVPRATLARRRKASATPRLSADEGAKVARLASVWAMAREVWGSDEAARAFLHRSHPLLEGRTPLDVVLSSEFGGPLVEGILGRLQHGIAV